MEIHVNGWRTIELQLMRMEKRQGDLAQILRMTPAAISQIKKGSFLLNPTQLEKVACYLQFSEELRSEFYSELFNARLLCREPGAVAPGRERICYRVALHLDDIRPGRSREVPVADLGILSSYEAVVESIADFLLRNSPERKKDAPSGAGVCALRVCRDCPGIGLRPGSMIILESERYPEEGKLHLVALRDGSFLLREFHPEGDRITFSAVLRDSGKDFTWERKEISKVIHWIAPVIEYSSRY